LLADVQDAAALDAVRSLQRSVRWECGSVAAAFLAGPPSHAAGWDAALDALRANGMRAAVIVPLVPPGSGSPSPPDAVSAAPLMLHTAAPVTLTDDTEYGAVAAAAAAALPSAASCSVANASHPVHLSPVNVTATRTERETFATPVPVTVFGTEDIRERQAAGLADLFRNAPGLDVEGVGASQPRPVIRGVGGQRILLLEDGLRLNNSRREQRRGELPAVVDVAGVERVEVVRGAASVLYGSDAIGGVVNYVTASPVPLRDTVRVHGLLGYRYSSAGGTSKPYGTATGQLGALAIRVGGSYRETDPYRAPPGAFGDVVLDSTVRVEDTGVRDYNVHVTLGARVTTQHGVFARYERYRGEEAGFGFVEPEVFDPDAPRLQLRFPWQVFDRVTAGYEGTALDLPVADRVSALAYRQRNERLFTTDVSQALGPPGASLTVHSESQTDLDSYGFRVELSKLAAGRHLLVYGIDFYRDRSENTDTSTTTITGFGPPQVSGRGTPRVPYAAYRSIGAFVQDEVQVLRRLRAVVGMRYQDVSTETLPTPRTTEPPSEATDRTVVGAASVRYRVLPQVSVVGTVGRAFRSPNLVERFFAGQSPEGRGYWIRNTDLRAETSLNAEIGARLRTRWVRAEAWIFRNVISDAIRVVPTGDSVNGTAVYQNINVDDLRYHGAEFAGEVQVRGGVSVAGTFAWLTGSSPTDTTLTVAVGYGHRATGTLRYTDPRGRFWAEYAVRYSGAREDEFMDNPVGPDIPAFAVHDVRGGARIGGQRLTLAVRNLTDALYAESANVGFFRPEPGRHVVAAVTIGF
ncbi:MAG: TonB-dependent receptor, partial [Gemmatimonadales bacterium]